MDGRKIRSGELEKEIRTYDFLDKLKIDYQRIDHEAAMTMEDCEAVDKVLDATICKISSCATGRRPVFIS